MIAEKERLRKLAEDREAERIRLIEEEEERKKQAEQEEKDRLRAEKGSDYQSDEEPPKEEDPEPPAEDPADGDEAEKKSAKPEGEDGAAAPEKTEAQLKYEQQLKDFEAEEAESEEEFHPLDIKLKINKFKEENPKENKIPSELLSEAVRWRLSQNDCQNRGYILDGYPSSYQTAKDVYYETPE